jgi:hypothetical protein
VQITEGVQAGDRVVASGAYGLPDNAQIKVEQPQHKDQTEKSGGGAEK